MPTAVKERILNLITKDHQKYFEIVEFFLDASIPNSAKELKAFKVLENEIKTLDHISDMPDELDHLVDWIHHNNRTQCEYYKEYLDRRKQGGGREYFSSVSKAYEFLYKVAPTKKVDGSWLYSFTQYWNDPVFRDFIQIYLEELGLGSEKANHVRMYDDLLLAHGLNQLSLNLSDAYYHQAAIQLALAYAPSEFIPEIAGFNLGYEQLPLHLLISNYELKELGIDAHYFNVHITIDNFDNGHAQLATNAIKKLSTRYRSEDEFIRKLKIGYLLNNKGMSSVQIIKNLSTEKMVLEIFKKKAIVGKHMHSNKCMFNNRTTNEWLSEDDSVEEFIFELVRMGWIKLNRPPEESRFWQMIHDEEGKMFGVFNAVEKTFIYDWIAGKSVDSKQNQVNNEFVKNFLETNSFSYLANHEMAELKKQFDGSTNTGYKINKLLKYLAPHMHHQEIGLWSTQRIVECLFPSLARQ
ncbi:MULTISPECIES: iron-containing redox enzyme family protein [Acinetobacter]|uniref:iron-containing redox enzyme family protein n=1 Tax=Acinetobacter TaxID=469 RepID=UPI00099332C2|nr:MULTISPECIES: iron-containing redox enzyme family protein [Acinetobacter]MCL6243410.1 iron-containing redox enzyme family protein [Acinetobacter amyesii]OOV81439.1 hypothetical protein B1201_10215 [Acinetobacter sp. ANC 5600]